MATLRSDARWYQESNNKGSLDPAKDAYDEAVKIFSTSLSKDPKKHDIVSRTTSINDLYDQVAKTQKQYEDPRESQKVRRWLSDFSVRVKYYGNIMDVMVQHHPEYVALVWGAMKFLFMGVVNHENMISSLARCLCQIADVLPQVQLAAKLYPTDRLKHAAAELYAYIIRILIRAYKWYQENKFQHLVHSITRPDEIRNDDLKAAIQRCTRNVEALSEAGSRAEIRDMHIELQKIVSNQQKHGTSFDDMRNIELHSIISNQERQAESLEEIRKMIALNQQLNATAQVNTDSILTPLQCDKMLVEFSLSQKYDFESSWQKSLRMQSLRRSRNSPNLEPFWKNLLFTRWGLTPASALLLMRFPLRLANPVQDIFMGAIENLKQSNIPVLWSLNTPGGDQKTKLTPVDALKSLALQALSKMCHMRTEAQLSSVLRQFRVASSEDDWLSLLGSLVESIPQLYIVVNLDCLGGGNAEAAARVPLDAAFIRLINRLSVHNSRMVLKVALLTARPIGRDDIAQTATRYVVTAESKGRVGNKPPRTNVQGKRLKARNLLQIE